MREIEVWFVNFIGIYNFNAWKISYLTLILGFLHSFMNRDGVNVTDAIKCNRNVIDCKLHAIVRVKIASEMPRPHSLCEHQ